MADPSDTILARLMTLHPKIIDLTLDRMWRLLDRLGNPQEQTPLVIHIAGTNGKGSTLAMIRAGLEAAGHSVHAYTSPHLVRFHERIRLAGDLIAEDDLSRLLDECEKANDGAPITYFEITTCAAFLAFARHPADYLLLEVGLGGRLDATNVVTPKLSVITPVYFDHEQYLGPTLADIAGEKAGILKRNIPAIIARQHDEALDVIEAKAREIGAPLLIHGQHWHVTEERGRLVFQDETGLLDLPLPNLPGAHQIGNAGTALAVLRQLGVKEPACEAAVTQARWPARLQRLRTGPLADAVPQAELWLDGGHNPAAGQAIANTLSGMPPRPLRLVAGLLNTKDASGFFAPFKALGADVHTVTIPDTTATLSAEETAAAAQKAGLPAQPASDVLTALREIAEETPTARILICGSLYLAGEVLRLSQE
ncbi:bifunctional folylpolyglutamate synthase/dihydrofolate synthase [Aestuariibius sp. 2305UL40-4]|uniref:bifunctional folylpolyglutamate synthase/dihydrofolate synthase n=1 Tax=Aestuariibius violaceus TaxID=3234132 RepID=UPI00345ED1BC